MSDVVPEPERDEQPPAAGEQSARSPYFTPRRLGATAPHDCEIWRLDFREGMPADSAAARAEADEPIRRLEDEGLLDELGLLLDAGLRVRG
jgi:hypothetical protein